MPTDHGLGEHISWYYLTKFFVSQRVNFWYTSSNATQCSVGTLPHALLRDSHWPRSDTGRPVHYTDLLSTLFPEHVRNCENTDTNQNELDHTGEMRGSTGLVRFQLTGLLIPTPADGVNFITTRTQRNGIWHCDLLPMVWCNTMLADPHEMHFTVSCWLQILTLQIPCGRVVISRTVQNVMLW